MRPARAALFAVVVAVLLTAPLLASPADADDDTVTVYGYVSDISNAEGNVPLAGVSVTLLDSSRIPVGDMVTGDDGRFEFTFEYSGAAYLVFEYSGYTVRTVPSADMVQVEDNVVRFTLDDLSPDADGGYALSGSGTSPSAFGMAATAGIVFGFVYGYDDDEPFALSDATVTIVSSSGRTYTTKTDGDGWFEAVVDYGTCTVTVSCSGFVKSDTVEADTYGDSAVYIYLEQKDNTLWLLDTPHMLMVIVLVVIGVILLAVYILVRRSKGSDSGVTVVDDLEDEES